MNGDRGPNIQDVFLNSARKQKVPVTVFLTNGVKLQGSISSFDNFSVVLRRGSQVQLIYKHAIATVVPGAPLRLYDNNGVAAHDMETETETELEDMEI